MKLILNNEREERRTKLIQDINNAQSPEGTGWQILHSLIVVSQPSWYKMKFNDLPLLITTLKLLPKIFLALSKSLFHNKVFSNTFRVPLL